MQTTQSTPQQVLSQVFGYSEFRAGQLDIIEQTLNHRDCLVIMPTGGGKSLCFQIPALLMSGITIVISPLISLMKDQVDTLKANGVAAAYLNSSQSREESIAVLNALQYGEIKLIYVAPERILQPSFLERIQQLHISLIAIDEAHCISQWGHDFRPEYTNLGQIKSVLPTPPIMALTATADDATRQEIASRLNLNNPFYHQASFDRPNIRYTLYEKFKPFHQLLQYLKTQGDNSGIIYCTTRKQVEETTAKLQQQHLSVLGYHGGMEHSERMSVQESFIRGDTDIVVATVAFGMGIDKPDVRFVIHYNIPKNIESYYQETGRAGRDGMNAEAVMLYDPSDTGRVRFLIEQGNNQAQQQVEHQKLNAMAAFAEAQTCRRQVLLHYFGEYGSEKCGNCDICLDPPKHFDGTVVAQKALSCVYRVQQNFGVAYVIDVLRGSKNQRILDYGHDKLTTYGIGVEHSTEYWLSIFRQLIHLGYLRQDITRSSVLMLNPEARAVLKGEKRVELAVPRLQAITKSSSAKGRSRKDDYDYDEVLFAKLRTLRKTIADDQGVPPYVVFSDASLAEMAEQQPQTPFELLRVNGVGERKLEKFGDEFLALIREYQFEN
ncbi:DNA helicase RecQ [Psychrobium sp. MM17-31]|uniref:DNA helicase RecQ n=1 Tax=Psychrobium sp. MM17-31 TaxID=2917758 RepID=UPI001EF62753|nr:DNA helicase RecQ [Psychrobium sp. MM17-31]